MKINNIIFLIMLILAVLTGFFIFGYQYAKFTIKQPQQPEISHSDTIYTTFIDSIEKPVPYLVVERDTFYKNIDTAAIIKEYYKEKYYYFPYDFGGLSFKITENSLFDYKLSVTTRIINNYIKPKYIVGVGGNVGVIYDKPFIELEGVYIKKQNSINVGISYPLGLRIGYKFNFYKY